MILLNWLVGLRTSRTRTRKSAVPKPAEVRHHIGERVECLEDRCVLSSISATYSLADASWFDVVTVGSTASSSGLSGAGVGSSASAITERQFLVRLTPEAVEQVHSPQQAEALFANSGAGLHVARGLGLPGQLLVTTSERDSARVVAALQNNLNVAHFEEDFSVGAASPKFPNEKDLTASPSQPLFSELYGLHNVGQNGGSDDADIDAPEAWEITTGSAEIIVSVIDSGVDFTHKDLYLNIWLNNAEIPTAIFSRLTSTDGQPGISFRDLNDLGANGQPLAQPVNRALTVSANSTTKLLNDLNHNGYIDAADLLDDPLWSDGIDTDNNGFEDDFVGWDFQDNDNRPFDEHGHGTHVAGILGATGDNGTGVVGVNWTTSILPLRFLDENNTGDLSDAIEAINYQTLLRTSTTSPANIRVSNNSWGVSGSASQNLYDAVAATGAADILFVAAAGNGDVLGRGVDNDQTPFYPANLDLPNVISVGAFGPDGSLARFSNFGDQSVDIAAPGVGIVSTAPGDTYITRNGTSMAAPFVTGTAALVFSSRPNSAGIEVRDALLQGADSRAELSNQIRGGRRLNALGAITAPTFAPVPSLATVPPITTAGGATVNLVVTYTDDEGVALPSIDAADLEITREGFSATRLVPVSATKTSYSANTRVDVTYRLPALGGSWDATDFGEYVVRLSPNQVADANGVLNSGRELGRFRVDLTSPQVFFVDTNLDLVDSNLSDGIPHGPFGGVSLRAAIMQANANAVPTTIVIPDGVYTLTLAGRNEDASSTGDLDLKSTALIMILGGGASNTRIDAQQLDRVFDIGRVANVFMRGLSIQNGNANVGGGIQNFGTLRLDSVIVSQNTAEQSGGGIFNGGGSLTVAGSSLENNQTTSRFFGQGGGGLATTRFGAYVSDCVIENSSIVNNISSTMGGGITALFTDFTMINSTVSGNAALRGNGGGLLIQTSSLDDQVMAISNTTIVNNHADNGSGGGLATSTGTNLVAVNNSIIAVNSAKVSDDLEGQVLSNGSNLFGQPSETRNDWLQRRGDASDFDLIGTVQHPLDPQLGPLSRVDEVVSVHVPLSGSPAIDNGLLVGAIDQLGNVRGIDAAGITAGAAQPVIASELFTPHNRLEAVEATSFGDTLFAATNSKQLFANSVNALTTGDFAGSIGTIASGDFNEDGFLDLVAGSNSGGLAFDILLGNGDQSFQPPAEHNLYGSISSLIVSDIDGDSHLDLIFDLKQPFQPFAYGNIHLLRGNGDGSFQAIEFIGSDFRSGSFVVDDLNGDGRLDLAIPHGDDVAMTIRLGNGNGTFQTGVGYAVGEEQSRVAVGDFDDDGHKDLIFTTRTGDLSLLRGNGDGSFQPASIILSVANAPNAITVGDFDESGTDDIVVTSGDGILSLLRGNRNGTFQSPLTFATGVKAGAIASDVNQDGHIDLTFGSEVSSNVVVLYGKGDASFQPARTYDVGESPLALVVEDFDHDGNQELVVATTASVVLLDGQDDGTFSGTYRAPTTYSAGNNIEAMGEGDFNRDGVVDLVVSNFFDATVSVLYGNFNGIFQSPRLFAAGLFPAGIEVQDFNGDGFLDLAIANRTEVGSVSVLQGDASGSFLSPVSFVAGSYLHGILAGHFDRDGILDLAVTNDFSPGRVTILKGFGNGAFLQTETISAGTFSKESRFVAADFDEDGRTDLAVGAYESIDLLRGNGDGTFETARKLPVTTDANSIVVADLNEDQHSDLIFTDYLGVSILYGNGDGTFQEKINLSAGPRPFGLKVEDFDHDGLSDIAVTNLSGTVSVLLRNADSSFQRAASFAAGTSGFHLIVNDFNRDGRKDVAVGRSTGTVEVLLGQDAVNLDRLRGSTVSLLKAFPSTPYGFQEVKGQLYFFVGSATTNQRQLWSYDAPTSSISLRANFSLNSPNDLPRDVYSRNGRLGFRTNLGLIEFEPSTGVLNLFNGPADISFQQPVPLPAGFSPFDVLIRDFNGDGRNDVLAKSPDGATVTVRLGNGNGTFQEPVSSSAGDLIGGIVTSDFNSDGIMDLMITSRSSSGEVGLLLGQGGGAFLPPVLINVGLFPLEIAAGDFDGDTHADVAISGPIGGAVLRGNGNGTFQSPITFNTGEPSPGALVVCDLNQDGREDLVQANESSTISVLLGLGTGGFGSARTYASGNLSRRLTVADFDKDGKWDVAVSNWVETGTISLLRGNGDGTLQPRVAFAAGEHPLGIVTRDFDRDGNLDLVVSTQDFLFPTKATFSVLRGSGDGTFQRFESHTYGTTGEQGNAIAAGDLNGDGYDDFVTTSFSSALNLFFEHSEIRQIPETAIVVGNEVFATSDGRLLRYLIDGTSASVVSISPVETRGGVLRRPDYEIRQMATDQEELVCLVKLTDGSQTYDLFAINTFTGASRSLLLKSNLQIRGDAESVLFADGKTLYLTVDVLGSRSGQELCAYSSREGFRLVADVLPGPESSAIQDLTKVGTRLYFTALTSRLDHDTDLTSLHRGLFVYDPTTGQTREVRAGSDVTSGLTRVGNDLSFNSRRTPDGPDYLWKFSTLAGAADIGAVEVVNGAISGVAFLDINGDGRRNGQEPGRVGVVIYEDQNGNGRHEPSEPFSVTRADDPATALDESGGFLFVSASAGLNQLRELLVDGFIQTSPQKIQLGDPSLTELNALSGPSTVGDRLTIPSIVGDKVVFANLVSGTLLLKDGNSTLQSLVSAETILSGLNSAIQTLGHGHAQDGSAAVLTATLANGRKVVFTTDLDQRIKVVAVTGTGFTANNPPENNPNDFLDYVVPVDLEEDGNHGFDSLSISGSSVGFYGDIGGIRRFFLGSDGQFYLAFKNAQVTLNGNDEVLVDRVIDRTPLVYLTGDDVFRSEASLESQYQAESGWIIRSRNGELLLPLTYLSNIVDISVSGGNVAFRGSTDGQHLPIGEIFVVGQIAEAIFTSNAADGLTALASTSTRIPNGTGNFTGFGSVADNLNSPSVAIDGNNVAFIGRGSNGQVGIYASINGQLRRLADTSTNFGGRVPVDFDLGHQAISGNRVVFHVNFSDGSEANYLATLDADATLSVTVQAGRTVEDVSFGASAVPGSIRGVSFTDANGNRKFDPGEILNANRTVFIDENFNGVLDQNERRAVTNSDGVFVFPKLAALTDYTIREVLPNGFVQTTPRDLAEATITLGAAQTVDVSLGSSFGITGGQAADGRVRGVIFRDTNGNGRQDIGEDGVGGLRVFVDENADRILNGGERSTTTAADGSYGLENLRGDRHAVRVEVTAESGLRQVSPLGNAFSKKSLELKDSPVEVIAGDFNGDGDDGLVASIDATNELQFFTNDGQGNFTAGTKVTVGVTPGSLAVGHFVSGSNRAGVVVGHREYNSVQVLLPQANGSISRVELVNPQQTFNGGVFTSLGNGPYFVTTGDFNGDGLDDIAVASANGSGSGAVAVFRSNGTGGFIHEQTLVLPKATSESPSAIVAAKLNGDALVDLAVASLVSNRVTLLRNTGTAGSGRFALGASMTLGGTSPLSIQAGDLDGVIDPNVEDLSLDLVTTNFQSDNVSILRNNGSGTFAAAEVKRAGKGPAAARIVDLDNDGNPDIVFTNVESANRFGVLRNLGNGQFQAAELSGLADLSLRTLAFSLAVGQFNDDNGDGVINSADTPDVAVSNRSNQTIDATAGGLTIGKNTIVSGALQIEFTADQREVNGVNFALQQNSHSPTFDALSDLVLDEDAGPQTLNLTGITDGGDGTQAVRVRASSSNTALIPTAGANYTSGMSGTLTFTPAANESGFATISVDVANAGFDGKFDTLDDGKATFSFVVTVRAVNDVPSFAMGANQDVNEDSGIVSRTSWATGMNRGAANESAQSLSFVVSNDTPGLFSVQPSVAANGTLTFMPASNANGTATVTVRLRDNGGTALGGADHSLPQTFTITVRAVNDMPSFTKGINQSVSEDAGAQTVPGWATLISTGPANEATQTLTFDVSTDQDDLFSVRPAIAANGTLTFTPADNAHGSAVVTVVLSDNGGFANGGGEQAASQTFTITVNAVNDAPTATPQSTSTNEEVGKSITLSGNDNDLGVTQTLTFAIASQPAHGTLSGFNANTGAVTYTPELNYNGSDSFTFTVRDDAQAGSVALTSTAATVTLTVNPLNDAPLLGAGAPIAKQILDEDTALTFAVPANVFVNVDPGDMLTLSANATGGLPAWLSFNSVNNTFSGTPANSDVATTRITLTATDSANTSISTAFDLQVRNVNDAPTLVQAIPDRITPEDSAFTLDVSSAFSDQDVGDVLTLTATKNGGGALPAWLTFTASTKRFSGTPSNADVGAFEVAVTAKDQSNAATTDVFQITVSNINDAPTLQRPIPDRSATEGLAFSFTLAADTFADMDVGDTLTLRATKSDGSALPLWLSFEPSTGTFSGIPATTDLGTLNILVTATDKGSPTAASVSDTFILAVNSLLDLTYIATAASLNATVVGDVITVTNAKLEVRSKGVLIATPAMLDPVSIKSLTINGGTGPDTINLTNLSKAAFTNLKTVALNGNAGKDTITGSDFDETISGGSGVALTDNDSIDGGGGTDRLVEINITAATVTVSDSLLTGLGTDTLLHIEEVSLSGGGTTANTFNASAFTGRVTLLGGAGNDVLTGGSGNDSLDGGSENDKLTGGLGDDVLLGGAGLDTLVGSGGTNYVLTNTSLRDVGTDTLQDNFEAASLTGPTTGTASVSIDAKLFTGVGTNTLTGGNGNDRIIGGTGKDLITGGTGDDVLTGGLGNDTFDGGAGNDKLVESASSAASGNADFTLTNTSLTGGLGSDSLVGNSMEIALLTGGPGDNRLIASAFSLGAVTLDGGGGNDVLIGGSKNDSLLGGDGRDLVIGGLGIDTLSGNAGDDILIGGTISSTISTPAALNALMAEWTSTRTYAERISKLMTGGGANGTTKLNTTLVVNDAGAIDRLNGNEDIDWFFQSASDVLDAISGEFVNDKAKL